MFFDRSRAPGDVPAPPTPDKVAEGFPVPLLAFVDQPSLEEAAASRTGETSNGVEVMAAVALSYTVWRNPADHDDPANLAELPEATRAQLDQLPPWPLPDWLVQWRARMHYPLLWDAVRTTWRGEGEHLRGVERVLVDHVNYIVTNQFRDERMRGDFPGELVDPATLASVDYGVGIAVDGKSAPGVIINSDAHVVGLGADLGDRVLTAVVARQWLPLVVLEFATRATHR